MRPLYFTLALGTLLLATSSPAEAANRRAHDRAVQRHGKARRHGKLAAFRAARVKHGGKMVALDSLEKKAFRSQRELAANLRRAKRGVFGNVTADEDVTELDDGYVITYRTGLVIDDPKEVEKVSPRFKKHRRKQQRRALSRLDGKMKGALKKLSGKVNQLPKGHPLRRAYERGGMQGLLDAMMDGKGYWGVTQTIVIPKAPPQREKGGMTLPVMKDGEIVPGAKRKHKMKLLSDASGTSTTLPTVSLDEVEAVIALGEPGDPFGLRAGAASAFSMQERGALGTFVTRPLGWFGPVVFGATTKTGTDTVRFRMLSGFTETQRWEHEYIIGDDDWTETYARFYFFAGASLGMRFPLQGKAVLKQKNITVTGARDRREVYATDLTMNTTNGDPQFYRDTGLDSDHVLEGKEFVLEAGLSMAAYVYFCGERLFKAGVSPGIDEGAHYVPPMGSAFTKLRTFWVPAATTNTDWTILGYGVDMQLGAKIEASGSVGVTYTARAAQQVTKSWREADPSVKRDDNYVEFNNRDGVRTLLANTTGECDRSCNRVFGFRVKKPKYVAHFRATPGLKLSGYLGFPVYADLSKEIWLDWLALDLGSYTFGTHENTNNGYTFDNGNKAFVKQ